MTAAASNNVAPFGWDSADVETSTIHHAYIACLETEPWYLLVMDADTGTWLYANSYSNAFVAHERHEVDSRDYEVCILVPTHVANMLVP